MAICFPGSQFIARSELIAKNCAAAAYALHAASAAATMADRIVGVWIYIHIHRIAGVYILHRRTSMYTVIALLGVSGFQHNHTPVLHGLEHIILTPEPLIYVCRNRAATLNQKPANKSCILDSNLYRSKALARNTAG